MVNFTRPESKFHKRSVRSLEAEMASVPLANTFKHFTSPAAGQGQGEYISWEHFDFPTTKMPVGLEIPWFTKEKIDGF